MNCFSCKEYMKVSSYCASCTNYDHYVAQEVEDLKQEGTKFDTDKLDWTLIPWKELEETVKVLEFGANKYSRDNWKKVDSSRYEKAAMRHLISYVTGEKVDPESGKSHLAHIICNALFLSWKDKQSD